MKIALLGKEKTALFALCLCLFFYILLPYVLVRFFPGVLEVLERMKLLMLLPSVFITFMLVCYSGERILRPEDLKNIRFGKLILYGICMFFLCGIAVMLWMKLLQILNIEYDTKVPVEEFIKNCNTVELAAAGVFICSVVPFCEEFIFRRILFEGMRERCPMVFSMTLTSLFFAALHGIVFQLLPLFMLGFYFQLLYIRHNRIGESFFAHCFNNSFAFLFLLIFKYCG